MGSHTHTSEIEIPAEHSAGSLLRKQREQRQLSLEAAAEATKIGKNYLVALENDRYDDLPSPAYLKGFLRTYAVYLGLDPEQLIGLATKVRGGAAADIPPPAAKTVSWSSGFNWQRLLLPALLLGALLISTFFIYPAPPRTSPPSPEQQQPTLPQPVTTVLPPHSSAVFKSVSSTTEPARTTSELLAETPPSSPAPQDGFMVRMKVKSSGSLSVTIDDAASQRYDLNSGDLIEWKAVHTIALDLSDPGGVDVEINGAPLDLKASAGGSAYIVLDAQGIKH